MNMNMKMKMKMKIKKTIRMPKELLKKWLEALRSGKYKQGKGRMGSDNLIEQYAEGI